MPSPIRVLVQNPILAPYRLQVFQALSDTPGLEVTYAYGEAQPGSALQSIMAPPGLQVRPLKNNWIGNPHKLNLQFGLLKALKEKEYDAVILGLDPRHPINILAAKQARKRGIKVVWWGHGIRPGGRFQNLYKNLVASGDATILYTEPAKEEFVNLGIDPQKLFVAWNSIDTVGISKLSAPYGSDRNVVLYVGRLIPEKKPLLLARGFAKAVQEHNLDATLVVLGEGPEKAPLEALVKELGIQDRTEILGATYEEEKLAPHFNRAYVSVSPGYVGLSAVHCLAYGVPMLAADNEPHSPEIVAVHDGENSLFFQADDPAHLAERLVFMHRQKEQMAHFSQNAKDYISANFSAQGMAQNMYQALQFAINSTGKS